MTAHSRGSSSAELLRTVRENPALLVHDPAREIRSFRVALQHSPWAPNVAAAEERSSTPSSRGRFLLCGVLGDLKTWSAAPPKFRPRDSDGS